MITLTGLLGRFALFAKKAFRTESSRVSKGGGGPWGGRASWMISHAGALSSASTPLTAATNLSGSGPGGNMLAPNFFGPTAGIAAVLAFLPGGAGLDWGGVAWIGLGVEAIEENDITMRTTPMSSPRPMLTKPGLLRTCISTVPISDRINQKLADYPTPPGIECCYCG